MPGLIRGVVRTAAVAGTATAVSNRVSRRQAERWAAPGPAPAPQMPATVADPVAQLKELAQLRDAGVLTDEEFAVQKRRLLGM